MMKFPLFIATADLHLSIRKPRCRGENDWIKVLRNNLQKLEEYRNNLRYDLPVLVAGDIFDRWNEPVELVNKLFYFFPKHFYYVPGQHDLPYHRLDEDTVQKSILWNFYLCARCHRPPLKFECKGNKGDFILYVKSYSAEIPVDYKIPRKRGKLNVLLTHEYVYRIKDFEVDEECYAENILKKYKDFDVIISGDNHKPFVIKTKKQLLINCGSMLRLRIDQKDYEPCFYVVYKDEKEELFVEKIPYDYENDEFVYTESRKSEIQGVSEFVNVLKNTENMELNFIRLLKNRIKNEPEEVQNLINSKI